ncbi:hypothetical protein AHAS_Ahas18G0106900 [Arachis hypogaea]
MVQFAIEKACEEEKYWRRFAIQEKVFAFGLKPSTPPKKPPGPMTEIEGRKICGKKVKLNFPNKDDKHSIQQSHNIIPNLPPLYQYGDANNNNNNNMNNQERTLNLNLEFGYDLNHVGAIGVGGAINADPFVSCVDENFEYGSGCYEVEKK